MTHRMPATTARVPNLNELLRMIRADADLPKIARGKMINAVRSLVKYGDLDPTATRATLAHCRAALLRIEPAAAGITRAHLLNIRSALRLAFARYAGGYASARKPLSPSWATLRAELTAEEPYRRLIRFIRWCDAVRVFPAQVNDEVTQRYFEHLASETTVLKPKDSHRLVCLFWNKMAATTPGWPQRRLTVPCYRVRVALPIDAFPKSFRADLDGWKRSLTSPPPLGPAKPLRSATIHNMVGRTMRFASILVREGIAIGKISSLAVLTKSRHFRLGMDYFWRQAGCKATKTQHEIARTIVAIARHWVRVRPARLIEMSGIVRQLSVPPQLSEKSRNVLRQFDDPVNVAKLVWLPRRLELEAEKTAARGAHRTASLLMQRAVAIEILLVAPLRVRNLACLQLGVHFQSSFRDGRRTVCLVFPPDTVKNSVPLEFEMPKESVALIGSYLANHRAHLVRHETMMLFPGGVDGHKGPALSTQIKDTVRRYTGLQVHPHAFRHVAAKLHLMRWPNDYVPVSLMLGHKSVETTRMFYCQLEMRSVARQYAEEVLGRRFAGA